MNNLASGAWASYPEQTIATSLLAPSGTGAPFMMGAEANAETPSPRAHLSEWFPGAGGLGASVRE